MKTTEIIDMGPTKQPIHLDTNSPRVIASTQGQGVPWLICDQRERAAVTSKNSPER